MVLKKNCNTGCSLFSYGRDCFMDTILNMISDPFYDLLMLQYVTLRNAHLDRIVL